MRCNNLNKQRNNAHKKARLLQNVLAPGLNRLDSVSSQSQPPALIEMFKTATAEILLFVSLFTDAIFFMTFLPH